jgi:hypothetical protein
VREELGYGSETMCRVPDFHRNAVPENMRMTKIFVESRESAVTLNDQVEVLSPPSNKIVFSECTRNSPRVCFTRRLETVVLFACSKYRICSAVGLLGGPVLLQALLVPGRREYGGAGLPFHGYRESEAGYLRSASHGRLWAPGDPRGPSIYAAIRQTSNRHLGWGKTG